MIIADETDEAAMAKWEHYKTGTDYEALAWRDGQAGNDKQRRQGCHRRPLRQDHRAEAAHQPERAVGSYARIAAMLDDLAAVPGVQGAMLTFDDFVIGMEQFGTRIQPLMQSRRKSFPSRLNPGDRHDRRHEAGPVPPPPAHRRLRHRRGRRRVAARSPASRPSGRRTSRTSS